MKSFYTSILIVFSAFCSYQTNAQPCALLNATVKTFESRCAATGAIKVTATGGSGSYKYRVSGPVNVNFTSADSITGLSAGSYLLEVNDIGTGCKIFRYNIIVPGNYSDPRFNLHTESVSCDNGVNGTITVENVEFGRPPFTFSIVAPSPMGVGTTNTTGVFSDLMAGDYSIRLTDSCGGIQTRTVSVRNYTWRIDAHEVVKFACDSARGWIRVVDSRGNVSTIHGIPGMEYGIYVDGPDTTWSTDPSFTFPVDLTTKGVKIFAKDACGNIKSVSSTVFLYPAINTNVSISNRQCSTFTASLTGIRNFFAPEFCLFDNYGNQLDCNTTGVFTALPYGSYCIRATDACADTVITRCFTANQPVPYGGTVRINNKTCSTFNAAITGQANLINPQYCLYDSADVLIECNTTGAFTNLPYGDYCIRATDECTGQVFNNCFSVGQPHPIIAPTLPPSYVTCEFFGMIVGGDSIYNPIYCLRDTLGNIIQCNNTGIFDSIPLGSYCVTIYDECRDTTIERCFSVGPPEAINDMVIVEENRTCSTFTARVNTDRHAGREFVLYDADDVALDSNFTGVFTLLPYGNYCVKMVPECPDTLLVSCITAIPPEPGISALLRATNRTCSSFSASVTGQRNLTDPVYFLTNEDGDTLASNNTGRFDNLAFGSYCILIKDNCFDTTLKVCGTVSAQPFALSAIATKSCDYGTSKFTLSANTYPVTVLIFNPSDVLVYSGILNSVTTVDNFPDLPDGEFYKILAEDACDGKDSVFLSPVIGWFRNSATVTQKCPGANWANGSGNINASAVTNTGKITVRIIKKDGVGLSPLLVPNLVQDSVFIFQDLGPGSYIVRYNSNDGCNRYFYDTVLVRSYSYPNLSRSSAYQCDVSGFSVGAVVTNGVGPFTYEIIGSTPAAPSIIAGPQSDPLFSINNGHNYSLIRLRALDACGNATLGDASVLPLASNGITVSENCIGMESVLSVDTVYNASVRWYYKENEGDTDSTLVGEGFQLVIDPLSTSTVGYYIAVIELNNGCITRRYRFHLNGDCHPVVPVVWVDLSGRMVDGKSTLFWGIKNDLGLKEIIVERKQGDRFETIGKVDPQAYVAPGQYRFTDDSPLAESIYRLQLAFEGGKVEYSNIIHLMMPSPNHVSVYPNPATDYVVVDLGSQKTTWQVEMVNVVSQKTVFKKITQDNRLVVHRTPNISSGVYLLRMTDTRTGKTVVEKIAFLTRK